MAYADQKMSGSKITAIVIVALVHAALGYAFVTGLAFQYVKKVAKDLNAFDVEEPPPPPPDEPPPPPPDQPLQPPPVVSPPPLVSVPTPPIVIQTVQTPPPTIVQTPVAAPAPPPAPRVSQRAALKPGDLQRLFGDPANYPDSARDAGEQGSVAANLSVGADGRITACSISGGSGSRALDDATCRISRSRIKMTPAKDDAGNPIASQYTLRVRWQLPEE